MMGNFYAITFKKRERRRFIVTFIIVFCFIFLLYYGTTYFFSFKTEPTALIKGNKDEKTIALTFNISWGEERVNDILEVLEKQNIRATFFVSGEWAERHPQIIKDITKQQHELGMLGYRYKNYLEQEVSQVRKDMIYAKQVFAKLGYKEVRYIRPPSGLFNEEIIALAESIGLEVIHWSINSEDWTNPGVEEIVANVEKSSNGDIILLHASDIAKQTANALQILIPHFTEKKFSFVTISELKDGVTAKEKLIE